MADTVHVPGLGEMKKPYLYGGIAISATLAGVIYWRHRNASLSNSSTSSTGTGSTAYDPNAIDPNSPTGQTYAEEASGNLGSFPYGGVSDYGGSYYGNGQIVGYDQNGNPIYSTGITGNQTYTTNSEWATQAEDDLATLGVSTDTAATAISRILAGLTVTTNQADLFKQAEGLDGPPPQGYPQPIKISDSGGQPGHGTGKVSVPGVIGEQYGEAYNNLIRAGLKVTPLHINSSYQVEGQSPHAGSSVNSGSTVTLKIATPTHKSTEISVPNVVHHEFGNAYNILVRAGFTVKPAQGEANAHYKVISQVPRGGSKAARGSTVTLRVPRTKGEDITHA